MNRRLVVLALASAACAPASRPPAPAPEPAAGPTTYVAPSVDELRRDLYAFAADSFRGRETGTPDADRAARFLAARLASLGVEPAGDSGYFQRVPLQRERFVPESRLQLSTPAGTSALRLGTDIVVLPSVGAGVPLPSLTTDADVVFASYGIVDPSLGRNDYSGLDVTGKVVVVVNEPPPGIADTAVRQRFSGARGFNARLEQVIPRRPAAVVILVADSLYGDVAQQFSTPVSPASDSPRATQGPRLLPMLAVAPRRAGSVFVPTDWPQNSRARALPRTRFTANLRTEQATFNAYNVVGVVRGRDAALRNSYVAYGAHYDHIGLQPSVGGDSVANGADDDASGSTALLALARALQQGPKPRRSVLFVWHVGEEKGLFGSARFVDHPTVPLDSVVAQLNADMIGRNGPDSLYIVGPAAAPNNQSRQLGRIVDSVNAAMPQPFKFNREWDSPTHPEQIYFRSDHYNYARKGVPIVFFTSGLHDDYHQVSDEPSKINYEKLAHVSGLLYQVGNAVANSAERPRSGAPTAGGTTP